MVHGCCSFACIDLCLHKCSRPMLVAFCSSPLKHVVAPAVPVPPCLVAPPPPCRAKITSLQPAMALHINIRARNETTRTTVFPPPGVLYPVLAVQGLGHHNGGRSVGELCALSGVWASLLGSSFRSLQPVFLRPSPAVFRVVCPCCAFPACFSSFIFRTFVHVWLKDRRSCPH